MSKELELWQFIASRLKNGEPVMLLVVAESSGSSPGRAGYKMAVSKDGELCGSIGGGVMEVNLVEQSRELLSTSPAKAAKLLRQTHRMSAPSPSGMICSGEQTVIFKRLRENDVDAVVTITNALENGTRDVLMITQDQFGLEQTAASKDLSFKKFSETKFEFREGVGEKKALYIIGGGHCALALSELLSRLGFRISIFDDRPELNTLAKNQFADEISIIDSYKNIAEHIPSGDDVYVVVMTLGYLSDAIVIRQLLGHDVRYFGVLGSRAKMATLMRELKTEGFDADKLSRIHTPIGIPINSRTPEEIAISIAAEIISIKNS
jgi:xanthine dehydrogenase accessory factor